MSDLPSLDRFTFHQITATPRPRIPAHDRSREKEIDAWIRAQLFAALTAAHAELSEHGAFAVAWDRRPGMRTLRVLVGATPANPLVGTRHADGEESILYPPGTSGRPVVAANLFAEWDTLPEWIRCSGKTDRLWVADAGNSPKVPGRGGFEDYVTHLTDGFVWLVVAQPTPGEEIDRELTDLEIRLTTLRARQNHEPDRIDHLRSEARYRELARSRAAGIWRVHVLVGGVDRAGTSRAARLLCSASDLDELPYALRPEAAGGPLSAIWNKPADGAGFASPFAATSELLAAIARPPRRELAGIRVPEPATFDVTPEHNGDVNVGTVLDDADQLVNDYDVGIDTLNRHTFVAGATGSGKSQTVRYLLEGITERGTPWLVIEPAKAEYARMAGRIEQPVTVIRPGDPDLVPVGLNPLEPEPGFPLQTHIDLVRALFLAAFEAFEPFPQVLAKALTKCYTDLGWNPVLSAPRRAGAAPKYPTLRELQTTALDVVDAIGYSQEITDNIRGFVDVRISSLRLGTPGLFFEGRYPIDMADLVRRNVVLEIESIGNDQDKAFFIGVILIRLYEHLWIRHRRAEADRTLQTPVSTGGTVSHITVVEEAHRLLKKAAEGTPAAHGVEMFASLLAEVRAYGEGIVVAEQIPNKITPDVVKNTALKIVHRLPAKDDRDVLGGAMNIDETQSRRLVSLSPGEAAVFADGMDRPIRIQVPDRERLDDARTVVHRIGITGDTASEPLTLTEVQTARLIAEDPKLVVWLELHTIAHLAGHPPPAPDPAWLAELVGGHRANEIREAIRTCLAAAVDDRYVGIAGDYEPERLLAHLIDSACGALSSGSISCLDHQPETRWLAGRYRYFDVHVALYDAIFADAAADQPHPRTGDWARRGLVLNPASGLAEQLDEFLAHHVHWRPDETIITGRGSPTVVEQALGQLSNAAYPAQRLHTGATHLTGLDWVESVLFPAEDEDSDADVS